MASDPKKTASDMLDAMYSLMGETIREMSRRLDDGELPNASLLSVARAMCKDAGIDIEDLGGVGPIQLKDAIREFGGKLPMIEEEPDERETA